MAEPLLEKFDYRLILGQIDSIDEENGTILVSFLSQAGQRSFNVPAPHFSQNSWIRAYPEEGSWVLVGVTQHTQQYEILKVFDVSEKTRLLLNYASEVGQVNDPATGKVKSDDRIALAKAPPGGSPFRKLRSGEIEASSSGRAFWWLSKYGTAILKGGMARLELESNFVRGFAAGYSCQGLDSILTSTYKDSSYFGVVRRPLDDKTFVAKKIISTSQATSEVQASITAEDENIERSKKLKQSCSTCRDAYVKALKSITVQEATCVQSLNSTKSYIDSLNTLKSFGQAYRYSQPSFNISISKLQSQYTDLQNYSQKVIAKTATLTTFQPVDVPDFTVEKVFEDRKKALQQKMDTSQAGMQKLIASSTLESLPAVEAKFVHQSFLLEQNNFCKEWRISLDWKGSPNTLYQQAFGHVYDDSGVREKSPSGKSLRSRQTWFTDKGNTTVLFCDVDGNVTHILSPDATEGYMLTIPNGKAEINVSKDVNVEIGEQCYIHVNKHCSIVTEQLLKIEAESIELSGRKTLKLIAPDIQIGDATTLKLEEMGIQLNRTATAQIKDVAPSWIHP